MAAPMNKADLLAAMAAHVRHTGLAGASLRPLARAAGTSDRMLIYHFGTKAKLIAALLDRLASEMLGAMNAILPATPAESDAALAAEIIALFRTPTFQPYRRIWLDILSGAASNDKVHRDIARRILAGQVDWIIARLPEGTHNPTSQAKAMLVMIQGALTLDLVEMSKAANLGVQRAYPPR